MTQAAAATRRIRSATRRARDSTRRLVYSALSAAIQANLTPGASRRRPRLFLGCRAPSAARDSLSAAERAPRARRSSVRSAVRPIGPGALDPLPQRGLRQIEIAGDRRRMLLPSWSTRRTAWALNSSSKCRRGRRPVVSGIRDIVSTFRNVSTRSDQPCAIRSSRCPNSRSFPSTQRDCSLLRSYRRERDEQSAPGCGASILYYRFPSIVVEHVPQPPESRTVARPADTSIPIPTRENRAAHS